MSKISFKIFLLIALVSFSQASWISDAWNEVKNRGKKAIGSIGDIAKNLGQKTKKVFNTVVDEARRLGLIEAGKQIASSAFKKQCIETCTEQLGLGEHVCRTECEVITDAIDDKVLDNINLTVQKSSHAQCAALCGSLYIADDKETAEECLSSCLEDKEISEPVFDCFEKCEDVNEMDGEECRNICTSVLLK